MRSILMTLVAVGATMTASAASAAPTLGDTVTCASNVFDCSASTATVTAATEFTLDPGFGPTLSADFSTGLLKITNIYNNSVGFAGSRLVFNDSTTAFSQAVLTSVDGVSNFDQSNISLTAGTLRISFGQVIGNTTFSSFFQRPGSSFTIQLGAVPAAVPEPATWGMMILGFGLAGLGLRRRARRQVGITCA